MQYRSAHRDSGSGRSPWLILAACKKVNKGGARPQTGGRRRGPAVSVAAADEAGRVSRRRRPHHPPVRPVCSEDCDQLLGDCCDAADSRWATLLGAVDGVVCRDTRYIILSYVCGFDFIQGVFIMLNVNFYTNRSFAILINILQWWVA